MAATKSIFVIKPRPESGITMKPRLVRAARRASAEGFLLGAFVVEKATPEQMHELGREEIDIEDVGE